MIIKAIQTALLIICIYVSVISFFKYTQPNINSTISYIQQNVQTTNLFKNQKFTQFQNSFKNMQFHVENDKIKVNKQGSWINIDIYLGAQGLNMISNVLDLGNDMLLMKSKYFTFIYSIKSSKIVYENADEKNEQIYFIDNRKQLWVFTYPNHNVLIFKVFNLETSRLVYSSKTATLQKVQIIHDITQNTGQVYHQIFVKFLTFDRNYLTLHIDPINYSFKQQILERTYTIDSIQKQTNKQTKIAQRVINSFTKTSIQQFLYDLTFGYSGKNRGENLVIRQKDLQYDLEAFDLDKNVMVEINKYFNETALVGFGSKLIPTRSPTFINKEDEEKMLPFDEAIKTFNDKSGNFVVPSIDIKLYEIKNKNLKTLKQKAGIYKLFPDAQVHFVTLNSQYQQFYPKQNINKDDFYGVRVQTGGVVSKGNVIKGIFQQTPVQNVDDPTLKFGYASNEVYAEQTTKAVQVIKGIFESHVAQKGLFANILKKKVELISTLNGKPVLIHALSVKKGYEYSTSFIQNNEFWVFEHKAGEQPIITKYEMFLDVNSPQELLSIKRQYTFGIGGRITRVQKCIDFFYYFTFINNEGKFGITRVHHALLSNRQPDRDGGYMIPFEKKMVTNNIPRSTKFKISDLEQQVLTVELDIESNIVSQWKQLSFKHQFKVLPMRIFSFKNSYYIFDLRRIMIQSYDNKMIEIDNQTIQWVLIVSMSLGFIIGIFVFVNLIKESGLNSKTAKQPQKKKNQTKDTTKKDQQKAQSKKKK